MILFTLAIRVLPILFWFKLIVDFSSLIDHACGQHDLVQSIRLLYDLKSDC